MKWTLRGKGYEIASTWHEDPRAGLAAFEGHWSSQRLTELQQSDALMVFAGQPNDNISLAAMAGIAVARGIKVIWIGQPVEVLSEQSTVRHFQTTAEFYKQEAISPEWLFAQLPAAQAA
jgi:hypothetical protein